MSIPWPTLTREQWADLLAHPEKRDEILAPFDAQVLASGDSLKTQHAKQWVAKWDESLHPREPAGTSAGGEFTSSPGGGGEDNNLALIVRAVHENGGFTYDPIAKQEVVHGFSVSVNPERMKLVDASDLTVDVLKKFRDDNLSMLQEDRHRTMGLWESGGKVYIDISTVFTDRAEAERLGREYRQYAIFDLDNKTEITLEGSAPTDEELAAAAAKSATGSTKPRLFLFGGNGQLPTDAEFEAVVAAIRGPESSRLAQKAQSKLRAVKRVKK